jgi:hypothetical protein
MNVSRELSPTLSTGRVQERSLSQASRFKTDITQQQAGQLIGPSTMVGPGPHVGGRQPPRSSSMSSLPRAPLTSPLDALTGTASATEQGGAPRARRVPFGTTGTPETVEMNPITPLSKQPIKNLGIPPGMTEPQLVKTAQPVTVDPKQVARDELKAHLDDPIRFMPAAGADSEGQRALQERYLDWAAEVHAERRRLFGEDYRLGTNMSPRYAEGYMSALFEALCGGIGSAARTPCRNAVVTALAPKPSADPNVPPSRPLGELVFAIDAMAIGGAVGGTGSFFAEKILLPALAEEAARRNLPMMEEVDQKALAPSAGSGVPRLVVRDGPHGRRTKQFYVPAIADAPGQERSGLGSVMTASQTRAKAEREQWWIAFVQQSLDGQHLGGLFGTPVMTGLCNAGRRLAMSKEALNAGGSVLGASMLASGGAGATTRFVVNAMKVTPYGGQTLADDLVGGQQRLNMYVPVSRGGGAEVAKWRDVEGLIPAVGSATSRVGDLCAEAFCHEPTLLLMDWFFRHVLPNVATSIAGPGYGGFLAQATRQGSFDSVPGESVHSLSNVVQQFGNSFFDDLTWRALQNLMAHFKADLVENRKLRQTIETERLQDERADSVERATGRNHEWAEGLRRRAESGRAPPFRDALRVPESIAVDTPENALASAAAMRSAQGTIASDAAPDPALITTLEQMMVELDKIVGIDRKLANKKNR